MVDIPAGWYPDGQGGQRWWDGQGWTEHVAPGQPEAAPEAAAEERKSVSRYGWWVALAVIAVLGLTAAATVRFTAPPEIVASCDRLASQAVGFSGVTGSQPALVSLTGAVLVEDHTKNYTKPTGSTRTLIYSCQGAGSYADGTQAPTLVRFTLASDGVYYVTYSAA